MATARTLVVICTLTNLTLKCWIFILTLQAYQLILFSCFLSSFLLPRPQNCLVCSSPDSPYIWHWSRRAGGSLYSVYQSVKEEVKKKLNEGSEGEAFGILNAIPRIRERTFCEMTQSQSPMLFHIVQTCQPWNLRNRDKRWKYVKKQRYSWVSHTLYFKQIFTKIASQEKIVSLLIFLGVIIGTVPI